MAEHKAEHKVELRRLVGKYVEPSTGVIRTAGWDMDQVFLNGKQIATISHKPGAPVGLLAGVLLTPSETQAVEAAIAAKRNRVKPASIGGADPRLVSAMQLLDDDYDSEEDALEDEAGDE